MADKVVVVKERRSSSCGCAGLALLAIVAVVGVMIYSWAENERRDMAARDAFDRSQRGDLAVALPSDPAPASPADAWRVGRSRDDMTDAVTYIMALDGLKIEEGILEYTPRLVIQLSQAALRSGDFSSAECLVAIEPEAVKRAGVVADVRIDQNPVEKISMSAGQKRSSVFFPNGFAKRLDGARTLIVRFETSLGSVRTLRFNIGGVALDSLVQKLKREKGA